MVEAFLGFGTLIKIGAGDTDPGPETFTAIPSTSDISGPALTRNLVDITHQESADNTEQFIAGLKNNGEVTFSINYLPDNTYHQLLLADFVAGTARNFQLCFSNTAADIWTFTAFVTGFAPSNPVKDKAEVAVTLGGLATLIAV